MPVLTDADARHSAYMNTLINAQSHIYEPAFLIESAGGFENPSYLLGAMGQEGGSIQFRIKRWFDWSTSETVRMRLRPTGTSSGAYFASDNDYTLSNDLITFAANEYEKIVSVDLIADQNSEGIEWFVAELTETSRGSIVDNWYKASPTDGWRAYGYIQDSSQASFLGVSLSSNSFNEHLNPYSTIASLTPQQANPGSSYRYTLVTGNGSNDNTSFSISGNQLQIKETADFEARDSYKIRIRCSDETGHYSENEILLSVNNVNEKPTDIQASSYTFDEQQPPGSVITTLSTTDPDKNNSFSYSLVSGSGANDNTYFIINGNQLTLVNPADYETKSAYSIRVRSTDQDGLFTEKRLSLNVNDINEAPTALRLTNNNFNENLAAGSTVALLSSIDPDFFSSFSYALAPGIGADDNAAFSINGNRLIINTSPDYEIKSSYSIRLRTTDQGGLSYERQATLAVNNIIEKVSAYTSAVLAPSKDSLQLYGSGNISATGNQANNTITGNSGNNALTGGLGKDILTGAGGSDQFIYNNHAESLLSNYDVITDYTAGEKIVASFLSGSTILQESSGALASLDASSIATLLNNTTFQAQQVASFTVQGFSGCFLAINDTNAGFQADQDSILHLQNYAISTGSMINVSDR
jgi:Ca2+-binding RTX toxin-like protein